MKAYEKKFSAALAVLLLLTAAAGCGASPDGEPSSSSGSAAPSSQVSRAEESSKAPEVLPSSSEESAAPPSQASSGDNEAAALLAKWEAEAKYKNENYVFWLTFLPENKVNYMAGWKNSEIAYQDTGTYRLQDGVLHLTLPLEGDTMDADYRVKITGDSLTMTYESGDAINIVQGKGQKLTYHKKTD